MAVHVLVVDDDSAFQRSVMELLGQVGLTSRAVASGEEALAALGHEAPLALIVDGLLPGMRGDELVRRVRTRWQASELPIVFVSAFFRDASSRRLLLEAGVEAVLAKPVAPEALKRVLARIPSLVAASGATPAGKIDFDLATAVDLLEGFLAIARDRMAVIHRSLGELQGPAALEAVATIRQEAHKFRGTGAAYGMPEVTRLGAQLELIVDDHPAVPVPAWLHAQISGLVDALGARLARAGAGPDPSVPSGAALRLLVVDGHGELADSCAEAAARGLPVRLAADAAAALRAWNDGPADVIVVAADQPLDGFTTCRTLRRALPAPIVAIVGSSELSVRAELVRQGAVGLIHRPADVESLEALCRRFARSALTGHLVAVSTDALRLDRLAEALTAEPFTVSPVLDARTFLAEVDAQKPDAVVVFDDLPAGEGASLIRVLRADVSHRNRRVLAVVPEASPGAELALLLAGANAVVPLDLEPVLLAARLAALVRLPAPASVALPGFAGAGQLEAELRAALARVPRGQGVGLLLFAPTDRALPKDRFEREALVAAIAARLRQQLRTSDLVAVLEGGRLAVVLLDVAPADAKRLLTQHREELDARWPNVLRSAAVSSPEHGRDPATLLEAATAALS